MVCVSALIMLSCNSDTKATMSTVRIDKTCISMDGKPFSGEVWSDDNKTYCLQVENGSLVSYTLYHPNGQPAVTITTSEPSTQFYDESGKALPLDSFISHYRVLADEVTDLAERIENSRNIE